MNENHLQQIFTNYIERFEEFNNKDRSKPSEYYKWEMPIEFKKFMDKALSAEDKDTFDAQLSEIKKITHDFIDSGKTLPFAGLVRFASKEWETVQKMFRELYVDDKENLDVRQKKIESFLDQYHQLEKKYSLGSLYKSDFRSVTAYLFLYDPDHNYIYKPTHAQDFQDCIEFYDDFGEGDHVKLKTYYRMCDQLVEAIKKNSAIQDTEKLRTLKFDKEPYPDTEKHILAYDIIYCCSAYNLFRGITFKHLTPKERKVMWEKQQEARRLLGVLKEAQKDQKILDAAVNEFEEWFSVGKAIVYKGFGKSAQTQNGTIVKKNRDTATINFEDGTVKMMGISSSVINGYVRPKGIEESRLANVVEVLKNKSTIQIKLAKAEEDFAAYSEYI